MERVAGTDVLVVDDEEVVRDCLNRWLVAGGARCRLVADGKTALRSAAEQAPEVVFLDIRLPDMSGLAVLRRLRAGPTPPEVVLISGYADVPTAVQGFRDGACDLIEKPFALPRLVEGLEVALARRASSGRTDVGPRRAPSPGEAGSDSRPAPVLVGRSPAMCELAATIERVAPTDATVLIEGETGTGKEVVARRLHALGRRSAGPFAPVNCGAIPETLLEAELFGHEPGAFTGATRRRVGFVATAHRGVLFLDEVGELTPAAQVKLLRVLQERVVVPVGAASGAEVDIRVIAATNRDLGALVRAGKFRQDLLFRLDVVRLSIPPLRERPEDVPPLIEHLLARLGARYGRAIVSAEPEAIRALEAYPYPGNVRELENVLERAIALGAPDRLSLADLPQHVLDASRGETPPAGRAAVHGRGSHPASPPARTVPTLETAERALFQDALRATGGNREQAARLLGVSSRTVLRKIRLYGLAAGREGRSAASAEA